MADLPNPLTRNEQYLNAIATGNSNDLPDPLTREEVYLDFIAKNGSGGGSGVVYKIKGAYDTLAELEADHPTGNEGDAYLVGSPSHVYAWLEDESEWYDAGAFTAVAGPKGEKGDKGDTGAAGAQGIQGVQGPQGIQGEKGDKGDPGEGIPEGGTAGQVLKKKSSADYDTEWGEAASPLTFDTDDFDVSEQNAVSLDARQRIFTGTTDQWNALSAAEKAKYTLVNLTDDGETGDVVDAVTDGDLRPVTSNAVYDATRIVLGTIEIEPLTIAAGQVATFSNTSNVIKGKRFNGIEILSVASFNISVTQAFIDSGGFHGVIKNNGSSEITTGRIIVHYSN